LCWSPCRLRLQDDPAEQKRILDGTIDQFSLVSDQLHLQSLTGEHRAGGRHPERLHRIWRVPFKHRPNWMPRACAAWAC
jgi:hypothetical protein